VALGQRDVRILVLSDRIALGLPSDRRLAGEVLNLYRPMKMKARVMVWMVKTMIRLVGTSLLKSSPSDIGDAEISWLSNGANVGFLGCNPGHGLRCVALSQQGDQPIKVTKFAIGSNLEPVLNEGEFLKKISGKYKGIPGFGGSEEGQEWAAFYTDHIRGRGPRKMGGSEEIDLLRGWLRSGSVVLGELPWLENVLLEAPPVIREKLKRKTVRKALVHGDFTPWNLRRDETGLVAIDWEWARPEGVGGLDLGHGLIMEALLVNGLSGQNLVEEIFKKINRTDQLNYIEECGWGDVNLWLAFALLYSSELAGVEVKCELNVLEIRVEHSTQIEVGVAYDGRCGQ
ncbi:hypothetical protein N9982_04010, partial [Akkermansiaceae bacterium]|nr:hypothetical protein [Akkermansiaceae bacterium]